MPHRFMAFIKVWQYKIFLIEKIQNLYSYLLIKSTLKLESYIIFERTKTVVGIFIFNFKLSYIVLELL